MRCVCDSVAISRVALSLHVNFTISFRTFLNDSHDLHFQVHDAGHMVPMDQPKNSLEMLYRWTRGKSLGDKPSDVSVLKEIPSEGDSRTESA